jgi:hypothetical protein
MVAEPVVTIRASALTEMASATPPTSNTVPSTVAISPVVTVTPSRRSDLNPWSSKRTV